MEPSLKCLIVDDEKPAHQVIRSHIMNSVGFEYAGSAYNGTEALAMLRETNFDILFLDINMPLINGIELMKILPERPVTIITTAYSDFALESYQQDAVDYLLKPIPLSGFLKAIEKAKLFCEAKKRKQNTELTIPLRHNKEIEEVLHRDILYIESLGNYVKVYRLSLSRPMVVYGTLAHIFAGLKQKGFLQIHRSFVVNTLHIKHFSKQKLILHNDKTIPVGRKYQILLDENLSVKFLS
ncbi:LytR/AlgR family response regulator transcription factor [Flavobacterium kingsejongi]|uniref:DNA-binding response regulator n=1 Tax=Flavobacterium kingsejongi TaxID=1678728 RepID=A0A2S1LTF3_9FLAO|nr:LytTR family DNA-binding domain-containing protein [Flavobacterium kingsejongi]AWG27004.1 DNA-binding response regulator [Flavobacterium kingsejongi]